MNLFLDTSVLIDVLRARNQRREFITGLLHAGHTLCTATLNVAELYAGLRAGEETATESLLAGLAIHLLSESAARRAGAFKNHWSRRGRTLTLADAIVAAVAIEQGSSLLTDNRKDFPMPELRLYPLP